MHVKRSLFLLLAAGVFAFLLSLWATHAIYRSAPVTSDENSYLFQAHCLAEGRIRRPYPDLSGALAHYMIIMDQEHGWLSRYAPGHAIWLAPGAYLGQPRIMIYLAAALSVILLGIAARQINVPPWAAVIPLVLSPYFINIHGTLLSHTSGFLFTTATIAAYLAWKRTGHRLHAGLAGLAWSLLFLNRTFTAGLIALPLAIDALLTGYRRRRERLVLGGVVLFAAAALLGVLAYHGYNWLAIGDAGTPTFLYYEASEGLGFGPRHTQRLTVEHTPARGLLNLWHNIVEMDLWLWGFRGSLVAALALAVTGWKRKFSPLLLAPVPLVWGGYVFFWFQGIAEVGGPVYYFEVLPMLILAAGAGLHRLSQKLGRQSKVVLPLLLLAAGGQAALFLDREAPRLRAPQEKRRVILDTLASAPPSSMVFVENMRTPRMGEVIFNPRGMASDPLVVRGRGNSNPWLWRHAGDRTPFLLDGTTPERLVALGYDHPPSEVSWEAAATHRLMGGNERVPGGRIFRVAGPGPAGGPVTFGRYLPLTPGRYRAWFELQAGEEGAAIRLDVAADQGHLIMAEETLDLPPGAELVHRLEFTTPERVLWGEPRVYYEGRGKVMIGRIGLEELPSGH